MELDLKSLNIFYNPTLGQIVATYGDTAISVYEKTREPNKRGYELINIALAQTGNVSICTRVEAHHEFNEDGSAVAAPAEKLADYTPPPIKEVPSS